MHELWTFTDRLPPFAQVVLWAALVLVTLLWIGLPFAVFGIKRRLERIRRTLEETNRLLETLGESRAPPPESEERPSNPLTIDYE